MCLINITCDFSRPDFAGVSRSVKTITIDQSTHTCYSLFQICACISLVIGRFKTTAYREHLFLTFHLPLEEHGYSVNDTPPSSGIKNKLCLCMAFPINTYLYILSNYCLTEDLRPSHTTVKSVNLSTLFLDMVSPSERVHIVSPVYDNVPT